MTNKSRKHSPDTDFVRYLTPFVLGFELFTIPRALWGWMSGVDIWKLLPAAILPGIAGGTFLGVLVIALRTGRLRRGRHFYSYSDGPLRHILGLLAISLGVLFSATFAVAYPIQEVSRLQKFTKQEAIEQNSPANLVGRYYQGDRLGYNLHLDLKGDGRFACRWSGCLGEYGVTSGNWSREHDRITIVSTRAEGAFVETPLGNMSIIHLNGEELLFRDADAENLKDEPEMVPFFSFYRIKDDEE